MGKMQMPGQTPICVLCGAVGRGLCPSSNGTTTISVLRMAVGRRVKFVLQVVGKGAIFASHRYVTEMSLKVTMQILC